MKSRILILIAVGLTVFLADQLTKAWVIENLHVYEQIAPIPFLEDFFSLTHSYNTGAAFGIFPDASEVFLGLSVVIVIGLIVYYAKLPAIASYSRVGIGMVIGGALGNMIDRIIHGHVTDFIQYTIGGISNISNIADHAVVIGMIIIILDSIRIERIEKQNNPEAEQTTLDS